MSSLSGSELSGGSEMEEEEEPSDVETHGICWSVPLAQFQLDPKLFRPKPVLFSPTMSTKVGLLTLDWQLSVAQQRTEAKVNLIHKTKGIPNLGVQYVVFAEKKEGGQSRLNTILRQALAKYVSTTANTFNPKTAYLRRFIFEGDKLRLKCIVKISQSRFSPGKILSTLLASERQRASDYEDGIVGLKLWAQICGPTTTVEGKDEAPPMEADVVFLCPGGKRVFAHKAVIAAFNPRFKATLKATTNRKGRWNISSESVGAQALWEVLYFIYNRKVSPNLYRASLSQVLEAARLFNQPSLIKLEVEKLLILCLRPDNAELLAKLASGYGLNVLANVVQTGRHHRQLRESRRQEMEATDDNPTQLVD